MNRLPKPVSASPEPSMTSRFPRFHAIFALLGCVLYAWCALEQGSVGALAPGDLPRSWPARVAGWTVHSAAEASFAAGAVRPGQPVTVVDEAGPRVMRAIRGVPPVSIAIALLVALAFGAACLLAFAGHATHEPARSFFWGCFGYGLAIASQGVHGAAAVGSAIALISLLRIASIVLTPLLLLRVALVFPRPAAWPWARRLAPGLAIVALAIAAFQGAAYLAYVRGDGAWQRMRIGERIGDMWIIAIVALGITLVWRNVRSVELARERQQAKWVAWGIGAGMLPFVLLYVLPRAVGTPPILPLDVVRLCALAVPGAFAIAVVRHQFMDIDVIIRRSLIYAAMAAMLTAAYLAIGLFLGQRLGQPGAPSAEAARITAAAIAIALFLPTRRAIGEWIDRTFFRLRTGHERAVREFRALIRGVIDPDEWSRVLAEFTRTTLGVQRVVVVRVGEGLPRSCWSPAAEDTPAEHALAALAMRRSATIAAPGSTGMPELEQDPLDPALAAAGLVLVRPLAGPDHPLGVLALGEKKTERRFVEPDLALIDAVAVEASAALERMLLVRRAAEEESRLHRQEELDRKKSEFLSQVAHDLGTPLTSILWSSQNLLDGVLGPLAPGGTDAARSIRDAASHLSRLVTNLVAIARLDDGVPGLRPEPVRLSDALVEAVSAIAPVAARKGVRIELAVSDGTPPAHCDREGLMKAALNLLDNAIKYAPPGSAIVVRLARPAAGVQTFAVEDHGPGVPDAQKQAIFERYARGDNPAPGARPGLGLGLFVARTCVEACGGTLDVRDVPGGGASFVCTLRDFETRGGTGSWPSS